MSDVKGTTDCTLIDGIGTLTMNFPERRNAFATGLRRDLIKHLRALSADSNCRVIVLTGAGAHFSAGGDIKGMKTLDSSNGKARLAELHQIVRLITDAEKPVIAAVEGNAAGGGMAVAAACDIVIAGEDAKFSCAFSKIGLLPDLGAVWTLPMRMGLGRAKLFLLTGGVLSATEAADAGLAELTVSTGTALKEAHEMAAGFAVAATKALGVTKSVLNRMPMSFDRALKTEAEAQTGLLISEDFAEGRNAFMEKRQPNFKGR